jgi:hypothetical protein
MKNEKTILFLRAGRESVGSPLFLTVAGKPPGPSADKPSTPRI